MASVKIIDEILNTPNKLGKEWVLCFQKCRYIYDNGDFEDGFRFIWRRPDKSLQPARGQARIPELNIAKDLINQGIAKGW